MDKIDTEDTQENLEVQESLEKEDSDRNRPVRKTSYVRKLKSQIPEEITNLFKEKNWAVRYKPYRIANEVQQSALAELLRDGWSFVESGELPDDYAAYFETEDWRGRNEILVAHDLVLMKADVALVQSQHDYYADLAKAELDAVDTNILEKRGFTTRGSKSSVTMAEPRFKE